MSFAELGGWGACRQVETEKESPAPAGGVSVTAKCVSVGGGGVGVAGGMAGALALLRANAGDEATGPIMSRLIAIMMQARSRLNEESRVGIMGTPQ
jgi:hypothetical protein